jgi:cytochrome c peroxidase
MTRRTLLLGGVVVAVAFGASACKKSMKEKAAAMEKKIAAENKKKAAEKKKAGITKDMLTSYGQLPKDYASKTNPFSEAKIKLGRLLYFDKRFSANNDISCNSCHVLSKYGVDNKPVSLGTKGQKGTRNSPTVYNAAGHFKQFWDGREPDVEAQAKGPVLNPIEHGVKDAAAVEKILASVPGYVKLFKEAFPKDKKPVSFDNFAKAIGAFERKLVTPSRWDKFQAGDKAALSKKEQQGFLDFVESGCPTCHMGKQLGGSLFQKLGLLKPWPNQKDKGRFEVTKKDEHKMIFKVPGLRNIEKTAPYFHDGSETDLKKVVKMMALHQVNKTLTDAKAESIVAFLKTLTGELPTEYIKEPKRLE